MTWPVDPLLLKTWTAPPANLDDFKAAADKVASDMGLGPGAALAFGLSRSMWQAVQKALRARGLSPDAIGLGSVAGRPVQLRIEEE